VTFKSQEVHPSTICDAVVELGYGAEVKETQPAQRQRQVARVQVPLQPSPAHPDVAHSQARMASSLIVHVSCLLAIPKIHGEQINMS
jgi:hypothetical protein